MGRRILVNSEEKIEDAQQLQLAGATVEEGRVESGVGEECG